MPNISEPVTVAEIRSQLQIVNKLVPVVSNIVDRVNYANMGVESAPVLSDEDVVTFIQIGICYQELARAMMLTRWKKSVGKIKPVANSVNQDSV